MKGFIKACLIAVLVFAVAGVVLLVVAAAGGVTRASLRLFSEENRLSIGPVKVHIGDGFSVNLDRTFDDDHRVNHAGKYLVNEEDEVVLLANGVYSLNKEVKELYVDVDAGDFTFLPSEDDYFYIENDGKEIRVNYENERLSIERVKDIHLIQIGFQPMEEVRIYIPTGAVFDMVSIDVDAGNITINNDIEAGLLEMDVDAGYIDAYNDMIIRERLDISVDAGTVCIDKVECFGKINAECDAGNIEITGHAYNDIAAECDAGSVVLELIGNGSKYNYEIASNHGNVIVNGNNYGEIDTDIILPGDTDAPTIKLSCDAGDMEVDIR